MANNTLRPPQASDDAASWVAPVVVSGFGAVTHFSFEASPSSLY